VDVYTSNSYVANDLADLRFAFPDDARFAQAVGLTALEIARALGAPTSWGKGLEHDLTGWRRSAFAPADEGRADLRLIFRARSGGGIEVLIFGPRHRPDTTSIYHAAKARLS
jgi:hypothetical protein